jgi:hypothetical protein
MSQERGILLVNPLLFPLIIETDLDWNMYALEDDLQGTPEY